MIWLVPPLVVLAAALALLAARARRRETDVMAAADNRLERLHQCRDRLARPPGALPERGLEEAPLVVAASGTQGDGAPGARPPADVRLSTPP